MIRNSFIFLERFGKASEERLWSAGITGWQDFLGKDKVPGLSAARKAYFDRQINEASKHLADYDSSYFSGKLPSGEAWRLYDHFKDDCLFLDIETTGYYGDITVIGLYDGREVMTLVKDKSLTKENLKSIASNYKMIATFNGQSFDLPVISRYFNDVIPDIPHLDLRFPLAKLGYSGGLKNIERTLGVKRSERTEGLDGFDAVRLWHKYKHSGDEDSLNLLVEYNTEDIINLKPLAEFTYRSMKDRMMSKFAQRD